MQRIQQRRRRLCHSTRRCLLFSAVVFILIGIHRHHEGVEGAEIATNHGCPVTQFRCSTTGRCVNLNVFCDGRNDCGDNSDEPAQCTRKYGAISNSRRDLANNPISRCDPPSIRRQSWLLSENVQRVKDAAEATVVEKRKKSL